MSFLSSLSSPGTIVDKAIFPAPEASYSAKSFPDEMIWIPGKNNGPVVNCLLLKEESNMLMILTHGNGSDIGHYYATYKEYAKKWKINILLVEYPGYGIFVGTATEKNINDTLDNVYDFVTGTLKVPPQNIVHYGHSIGTGVACRMAASFSDKKTPLAGLILQSPYKSVKDVGLDIAKNTSVPTTAVASSAYFIDNRWVNEKVIRRVTCPTTIIHGEKDKLIPISHAKVLYAACGADVEQKASKSLIVFPSADHNYFNPIDMCQTVSDFLSEIRKKISVGKLVLVIDKKMFSPPVPVKDEPQYSSLMSMFSTCSSHS